MSGSSVIRPSRRRWQVTRGRHAGYRKRRDLASRLRRAGLPAPLPIEGAVLHALAEAGLFAGGSVLVGSVAFQAFGGLLGVRFVEGRYRTDDIDLGHPLGIGLNGAVDADDVLEALRRADKSFEPMFHTGQPDLVAGFASMSQIKVEFLSPVQRGGRSTLAGMAGIVGVGAQPLKYFEYLLEMPTWSVVLHEAGVAVAVPDPMRYAVHKLLVAAMPGRNPAKARKDVAQAENLIAAADVTRSQRALGLAWLDAWRRGPSWRGLLRDGAFRLADGPLGSLAQMVEHAAAVEGVDGPFFVAADPRRAPAPRRPKRSGD